MKIRRPQRIILRENFNLNILMSADVLVIMQENQNDLQRLLFYLTNILTDYNKTIYLSKTKVMSSSVPSHIRTMSYRTCH